MSIYNNNFNYIFIFLIFSHVHKNLFSQSPRVIQKWTFLKMSNFKFCSTLGNLNLCKFEFRA